MSYDVIAQSRGTALPASSAEQLHTDQRTQPELVLSFVVGAASRLSHQSRLRTLFRPITDWEGDRRHGD
jgi:hypothetical protein